MEKEQNGYIIEAVKTAWVEHPSFLGSIQTKEKNLVFRATEDEGFTIFIQGKNDKVLDKINLTPRDAKNLAIWILANYNH